MVINNTIMEKLVTNFSRFYRAFSRMEATSEEMKCELVRKFSEGRTNSLKEIWADEYDSLCRCLELSVGMSDGSVPYDELRKRRSEVLYLMQKLGVDTTDWARVDDFCRHPKIAGQPFRLISAQELTAISVKLRAIQRKGGLKVKEPVPEPKPAPKQMKKTMVMLPLFGGSGQMSN
jgi:hypothetical protein